MRFISLVLFISLLFFNFCTSNTRNSQETTLSEKTVAAVETAKEVIIPEKKKEMILEKELKYDQHTLDDTYPYKDTVRVFQWDKIKKCLAITDSLRTINNGTWAIIQNRRNIHGIPPLTKEYTMDEYKIVVDKYGAERTQSVPVYALNDTTVPERYGRDGCLVKVLGTNNTFTHVQPASCEGNEYLVPTKYLQMVEETLPFNKVIVVDRNNQNISTFEKVGDVWKTRSMNPCTTGAHHPPLQKPTPLGMFVIQEKKPKMQYYVDGTTEIGGYAPWANRFCDGAYIHGIPVNLPHTAIIEYSATLGTTPLSHMCVRNASSHAKYIYDNFPANQSLVYVIE